MQSVRKDWILEFVFALLNMGIAAAFHRLSGNSREVRSAATPATWLLNGRLVASFVIMMQAAMVGAAKARIATSLPFPASAGV